MSYLDPPPYPAPVVVVKDVGGLVTDYQARTEEYRASNREVRLHECRSACTLALSLPNVCVYPNSILKFHLAYNENNRISDYGVSQQLFDSYPAPVRARLGTLTRDYHVLSGTELIRLGIRDCNEPHIMVASVGKTVQRPIDQETSLTGMMHGLMSRVSNLAGSSIAPSTNVSGTASPPSSAGTQLASREPSKPAPSDVVFANYPMPPARPDALPGTSAVTQEEAPAQATPADVPLPPVRPAALSLAYKKPMPVIARAYIMAGAAPILPSSTFIAFAEIPRWSLPE